MRLTTFAIFDQLTQSMNRVMEQYSTANSRLATGKKILAPSDDVNGMMRAMDYRVNINQNDQYSRNVDFAAASLKVTNNTLTAISNTVAEAKRLLLLSQNGSTDPGIRSSMSQAAAVQLDSMYSYSSTKYMGQYLFSGFLTGQPPYTITAPAVGSPLTTIDQSAGANVTAATVTNPAALDGVEYRIGFDTAGANYIVYNNADGSVVTPATSYNPAGTTILLPGMSVALSGGPVTDSENIIVRPPLSTYAYQGDAGVINVQIDQGAQLATTVRGTDAFCYSLAAAASSQISGGRYVHYTPGAGTTVNVEIRDTNDVTVLDRFSFSNVMDMTSLVSSAISTNNAIRMEALLEPFTQMQTQLGTIQADIGSRQVRLEDQSNILKQGSITLQKSLSSIEEADMLETAAILKTTEVTLQSLRESASRVLSQSLLDFLK